MSATSSAGETKNCPYCAETIREAIKCKHCGCDLSVAVPAPAAPSQPVPDAPLIPQRQVLELLAALVDKSLVIYDQDEQGRGRYRLLETVRQYAHDRLESGDGERLRQRHQGFYLALAEEAEPQTAGPKAAEWLDRLEAEHDNLRAALDWGAGEANVRLAGAVWRFWYARGCPCEGRARLAAVLNSSEGAGRTAARARALDGAGGLAWIQGDHRAARALHEESLTLARELGDMRVIALSLEGFARLAEAEHRWERAARLWGAAEAVHGATGVPSPPIERGEHDERVTAMGEEAFAASYAQGQAMTLEQAVEYALAAEATE